jgi:uncharacterized protein YwgA
VRKPKFSLDDSSLLLATMFFNNQPVRGRTRFQKMIYLLKEKYEIPFDANFKPYYYGPYSEEIADILTLLNALKFTEEKTEYLGMGITRYKYQLTDKGKKYINKLKENALLEDKKIIGKLEKYVAKINEMPTYELVSKAKSLMATKTSA